MDIVLGCNPQAWRNSAGARNLERWEDVGQTALFCITGQAGSRPDAWASTRDPSDVAPLPPIHPYHSMGYRATGQLSFCHALSSPFCVCSGLSVPSLASPSVTMWEREGAAPQAVVPTTLGWPLVQFGLSCLLRWRHLIADIHRRRQ